MAGIAKSATTPAHLTTLPVRSHRPDQASAGGLIKGFMVPSVNHLAGDPTCSADKLHEQCSQTTQLNPRAKRGKGEPMQDFHAWQENCSPELQCIWYLLEILVWLIILARVSPMLRPTQEMTRTAKPHSAHNQTTDQAGTNQAISHGYL